jgi:hypothetical protein
MEMRHHKGFSHGLRPGTTRDINCGACIQEDATRRAIIGRSSIGGPTREVVERYLPHNYKVVEVTAKTITISGVDNAGWTLDDYVIPRLASGLIYAEEVDVPDDEPGELRQRAAEELAAEFGNDPEEWLT